MPNPPGSFRLQPSRSEGLFAFVIGLLSATALFVLIAVIQKISADAEVIEDHSRDRFYITPPEEVTIEEEPEPEPEEPPEPELEREPPRLELSSLDIALRPGTGGGFGVAAAIPEIQADEATLDTAGFVNFADLDEPPRLRNGGRFNFSERIRQRFEGAKGTALLYIKINAAGDVITIQSKQSNLPEPVVRELMTLIEAKGFTPPKVGGEPTQAEATLPINLKIQ